jgi:hypothetical protein
MASFLDLRVALFGALIVFLLLMVLPVSIVLYEKAQPEAGRVGPERRNQLGTLALFLAWSSALLVLSTVLALLASVFGNWPVPLRYLVNPKENPGTVDDISKKLDQLPMLYSMGKLATVRHSLQNKDLTDERVSGVFGGESIDFTAVILDIDRKGEHSEISTIKVYVVFSQVSKPFFWCHIHRGDPDFERIIEALKEARVLT